MSRIRSLARRSVAAVRRNGRDLLAAVRRNGRDLLAIAGASSVAVGLASTPIAWLSWLWIGGFLLFTAGVGRKAS